MFGIFNLYKPSGLSSRTALNQLMRHLPRKCRAGHAGTLDPLANGVLVVCVGPATRLISRIQSLPKTYVGKFRFGFESPSLDIETEVRPVAGPAIADAESIQRILPQFVGDIQQVPPAFSAVRVDGKRAYALARKGKPVEIRPRTVKILELELIAFDPHPAPIATPSGPLGGQEVVFKIKCGSGTYIRSLGQDVAEALGSSAVMWALERTSIGPFDISDSLRLDDPPDSPFKLDDWLQSPVGALEGTVLHLSDQEIEVLRVGGQLRIGHEHPSDLEYLGVNSDRELIAILATREMHGTPCLHPVLNFANYYSSESRRKT